MIPCEVVRRHVDAVVDGEVDADTQIEFEQHLSDCGPCRVHLAFARSFRQTVKEACKAPVAPASLADRVRASLDAEDVRRAAARPNAPIGVTPVDARPPLGLGGIRLAPIRARYVVPAAAAAVALAVIAAQEGSIDPAIDDGVPISAAAAGTSIFEDIVRRHAHEHPAEIRGDEAQVARWFRGKLEFPVHPIAFSSPEVHLVGARLSNVSDREAAAFYYTVHGRRVTVMVFEPPAGLDQVAQRTTIGGRGIYFGRAHGHTVPVVQYEGLSYAFAGDLDSRSLLRLAASADLHR